VRFFDELIAIYIFKCIAYLLVPELQEKKDIIEMKTKMQT